MAKTIHYADQYTPQFGIPWVPVATREQLEQMSDERLQSYTMDRHTMDLMAKENPVSNGWTLPIWERVMANYGKYNVHVLLGGNQCLRGDTLIFDPVLGRSQRIDSITGAHHVYAWDGSKVVIAAAEQPFTKPAGGMATVTLSTGDVFCAAWEHRVLCADSTWKSLSDLNIGDKLQSSEMISVSVQAVVAAGTAVKWDMTVPEYGNYIAAGVVHHNSGKSVFGSRLTTWAAGSIPEAETYCWHVSEKRSIDDQQRFIYEALPASVKALPSKKGIHHSTQYSQKNGFTDSICILPPHKGFRRGGSINFFNYAQYQQNDQIIEGIKAHFIWADEKIPLALLETLKYRLFTYHARLLLTYTVIDGWNDTIEKILAKTRTIEKRRSERLKIDLPVVQESLSMDSCCIYYAWTEQNPFTDINEFWKLNATVDRATVLARAYGIPTKSIAGAFPAFSRDVNVVPHDELPFVKSVGYKCTRYMAIDPAGSKNWFMVWVAIDAAGTWWVYREWPDYDDWALPGSTVEGKPGPAQKGSRRGIKDYVELIRGAEGTELMFERYIDPRMGAAEKQSQEGATTIISDLDACDFTVIPAPGVDIDNGLQLINNLLAWDETKPRDSLNTPHLFISDRCQNLIYALSEYTGKGGKNESTKDPIDGLRYIAVSNPSYIEEVPEERNRTGVY